MSSTYVLCPNTRCRNPESGGRSWRWSDRGPTHCKFCNAKFRLPAPREPRKRTDGEDSNGKGKGRGKGNGKGKGRGGRSARRSQDESDLPNHPDEATTLNPEAIEQQLKKLVELDPNRAGAVNFEALFPKREKTAAEVRKEALDQAERAQTQFHHQEKVLDDMRASLSRKAQELLDYQLLVQEQEVKVGEAKQLYLQARHQRDSLDASLNDSSITYPPSPITGELNKYLAEQLQGVQIPASLASDIAAGINSIVSKVRMSPPPPPSCPPPPHPPSEVVRARVQREQLEAALEKAKKEEQDKIREEELRAQLASEAQARQASDTAGLSQTGQPDLASQEAQHDADMRNAVDKREGGNPEGEKPPVRRRTAERSLPDDNAASAEHITLATAAASSILAAAPARTSEQNKASASGNRDQERSGSRTPKGGSIRAKQQQPG